MSIKNVTSFSLILLFIATIIYFINPYYNDYEASVIPGWHTTVYSPYTSAAILLLGLLILDILIYWRISKLDYLWPKKIVLIHFIVSVILAILLRFPEIYFLKTEDFQSITELENAMHAIGNLFFLIIFLQFSYLIYILTILIKSKSTK